MATNACGLMLNAARPPWNIDANASQHGWRSDSGVPCRVNRDRQAEIARKLQASVESERARILTENLFSCEDNTSYAHSV
jgi:hypothetical protein